jgi:hypothetical protein
MCSEHPFQSLGFNSQPLPPGGRICYTCADENERRRVMPLFIKSGFAAGGKAAYLADVPQIHDSQAFLSALGGHAGARPVAALQGRKTYCLSATKLLVLA